MYPDYPIAQPADLASERQELARLREENEALRQRLRVLGQDIERLREERLEVLRREDL